MKSLAITATVAALVAAGAAQAAETARYEVRIDSTWTAQSHPLDYPSNAHHSGLVGATHNGDYRIFEDGATATPGLEALSERGAHSPLTEEVQAAIAKGAAGELFESQALFKLPGTLSATFMADEAHPFVSVAAMIAPSPDWFMGVSNVALRQNGKWVEKVTMTLFAWDAGTDGGDTYGADDADTQPRQSVRLNAYPHFKNDAGLKPVGTITFTQMKKAASN